MCLKRHSRRHSRGHHHLARRTAGSDSEQGRVRHSSCLARQHGRHLLMTSRRLIFDGPREGLNCRGFSLRHLTCSLTRSSKSSWLQPYTATDERVIRHERRRYILGITAIGSLDEASRNGAPFGPLLPVPHSVALLL